MHIDGYVGVVSREQPFDLLGMFFHQFRVLSVGVYVGSEFASDIVSLAGIG